MLHVDALADRVEHLRHRHVVALRAEEFRRLESRGAGTDQQYLFAADLRFAEKRLVDRQHVGVVDALYRLRADGFRARRDHHRVRGDGFDAFRGRLCSGFDGYSLHRELLELIFDDPVDFFFMRRLVGDVDLTAGFFLFFKDHGGKAAFGEHTRRFEPRGAGADDGDSAPLAVLFKFGIERLARRARIDRAFDGAFARDGVGDEGLEAEGTGDAAVDLALAPLKGLLRPLGVGDDGASEADEVYKPLFEHLFRKPGFFDHVDGNDGDADFFFYGAYPLAAAALRIGHRFGERVE